MVLPPRRLAANGCPAAQVEGCEPALRFNASAEGRRRAPKSSVPGPPCGSSRHRPRAVGVARRRSRWRVDAEPARRTIVW